MFCMKYKMILCDHSLFVTWLAMHGHVTIFQRKVTPLKENDINLKVMFAGLVIFYLLEKIV